MTTDGRYLYLYISGLNGSIYKIGTGNENTVAGKVYFEKQVNRNDMVCWVWIDGWLYLRNS